MTGPLRIVKWFLFPFSFFAVNLNVSWSWDEVKGTNEIGEKQNSLFLKGPIIYVSDLLKQKEILKNELRFKRQHQAISDHVQPRSTFRG